MAEYPYIRAWGVSSSSMDYYIERQVSKAREDNAPKNAIYKDDDGRWHTVDEIESPRTKEEIKVIAEQIMSE